MFASVSLFLFVFLTLTGVGALIKTELIAMRPKTNITDRITLNIALIPFYYLIRNIQNKD